MQAIELKGNRKHYLDSDLLRFIVHYEVAYNNEKYLVGDYS